MIIEQREIYQGRAIDLCVESVELPNGVRCDLEIVRHPGGAAAIALDDERRVCLLHQFRHAAGGWIWELPAGRIDHPEAPQTTAVRELEEEAGLRAAQWIPLGKVVSSPGVFTEVVYLYLARSLTDVGAKADEDEVFEMSWVPFEEAVERAHTGDITDGKTIIGLLRAERWLERGNASAPGANC